MNRRVLMTVAWLWVGLPFAYGLYQLVLKVIQLFGG
ncbi:MFS transporter small subunit [Amycolatopsis sp.]